MSQATRQAFGEALARLGKTHPEIVVLDADLSKSTKTDLFAKQFPERFFEMGISEANMIGVAAGLSFAGKIPFACSFGCFLTGRYDTIRLSIAYSGARVRLVGTHAGVGIGDDGHSQMGLEDIALMRALPEMSVYQPMDARETELLMEYLVKKHPGAAYLRLTRQVLPDFYTSLIEKSAEFDSTPYDPHSLKCLVGRDTARPQVSLIATGGTVGECVRAVQELANHGISAQVWNCTSLKPFDGLNCERISRSSHWVISVEDHSVIGGLGTCVAEVRAQLTGLQSRFIKLGIQDQFGESGEPVELYDHHGISARAIVDRILREMSGGPTRAVE